MTEIINFLNFGKEEKKRNIDVSKIENFENLIIIYKVNF